MARNATELNDAIANLEQILDSGASSISIDGETTTFDLDKVEARLRSLRSELATIQGKAPRRPIFNKIDLS